MVMRHGYLMGPREGNLDVDAIAIANKGLAPHGILRPPQTTRWLTLIILKDKRTSEQTSMKGGRRRLDEMPNTYLPSW